MTSGSFTVTIDAKPEVVWPWVADLSKHADWSPKLYRIEWLEGEPNSVGSRFHSAGVIPGDKHHENEGRITESALTLRSTRMPTGDDPSSRRNAVRSSNSRSRWPASLPAPGG